MRFLTAGGGGQEPQWCDGIKLCILYLVYFEILVWLMSY